MRRIYCLCVILAVFLSGCGETQPLKKEIFAMDTMITLRIWGDEDTARSACDLINRYDGLWDAYNENSDIYILNRDGSVSAQNETIQLLREAVRYAMLTDGCFDPTVYPLVQAWQNAENAPPRFETLQQLLPSVGAEHIFIDGTTVVLTEGTAVDPGAIAKGYTAQKSIELLASLGVKSAIISLGGNVQTLGDKPDGTAWAVGIADPASPNQSIATVRFTGSMALVTSGSYQRYYEIDNIKYHHILDPETGYPAENELASVTILADNGTMADAFSTALFVMGFEKACDFWRGRSDFEAIFIHRDGSVFVTEGAAIMICDCEFTVVER